MSLAKFVIGCFIAVYSQFDLIFDSYLLYIFLKIEKPGNESESKGDLSYFVSIAMLFFILLPIICKTFKKLSTEKSNESFFQQNRFFWIILPLTPIAIIAHNFVLRIRKAWISFEMEKMLWKVYVSDKEEPAMLLSESHEKGLEEMRRKQKDISEEVAATKLTEAVLEGQPQSVLKILLFLLFFSRTKVLSGGEAEFGNTDSLIPGVENSALIIYSVVSSVILNTKAFMSVVTDMRSKTVPFLGKLLLRSCSVKI